MSIVDVFKLIICPEEQGCDFNPKYNIKEG